MRAIWISSLLAASLAAFSITGCTIYGEKKPPTLKSTTSAEQYERIYWSTVKAKKWEQLPGMLAANVMYSVEWGNINQMVRTNVASNTLIAGDHVVVTGSAPRDPADHRLSIITDIRRPSDGWHWSRTMDQPGTLPIR